MMAKIFVCLALVSLLGAVGCQAADGANTPKSKLDAILTALLWKPDHSDPDTSSGENPGWYNPTNREALAGFMIKYPDTEDAYLAEAWLTFAEAATDRSRSISETKRRNAGRADRLKVIVTTTRRPGTAKIARIIRACLLLDVEDHGGLSAQVDDVLANIKDYKSEKDKEFLRFSEVTETPPAEIEPYLRRMLIISECHQHNLDKALALAQELKNKFPGWSKREGTDANIYLLKLGKSPYPTWEEMRDVGRMK